MKSWRQEGHLTNGNIQIWHVTRCRFNTWDLFDTASVRGGPVLYGLRFRDVKR